MELYSTEYTQHWARLIFNTTARTGVSCLTGHNTNHLATLTPIQIIHYSLDHRCQAHLRDTPSVERGPIRPPHGGISVNHEELRSGYQRRAGMDIRVTPTQPRHAQNLPDSHLIIGILFTSKPCHTDRLQKLTCQHN